VSSEARLAPVSSLSGGSPTPRFVTRSSALGYGEDATYQTSEAQLLSGVELLNAEGGQGSNTCLRLLSRTAR
jgi:hypothetical protein